MIGDDWSEGMDMLGDNGGAHLMGPNPVHVPKS